VRRINGWNVVWLLIAALCAFAASFWIGFDPINVMVDKEAGQVWPAWVQALGSIAAIVAAALIAYLQRRSENLEKKNESLARERSMASFLYKDFARWREKAADVMGPVVMFGVDNYAIPQNIYDHMRDLHIIGPTASEAATKAIGASLVARTVGRSGNDDTKRYLKDQDSVDQYNTQLTIIRESCSKVLDHFDELLGIRHQPNDHAASAKS